MTATIDLAALAAELRQINTDNPGQRQDYVHVVGLISAIVDLPSRTDADKLAEIRQTIEALRLSRSTTPLPRRETTQIDPLASEEAARAAFAAGHLEDDDNAWGERP